MAAPTMTCFACGRARGLLEDARLRLWCGAHIPKGEELLVTEPVLTYEEIMVAHAKVLACPVAP